jgi:polysaccharide pyruvyl transferase WcaK-like protein
VFGARLHACITSYALDIPVVGLIWSEKLQIFSEVIGKKESFFTEDNLHIEQILDAMQNAMDTGYDDSIREHLRQLTSDYLKQFLQMIGE